MKSFILNLLILISVVSSLHLHAADETSSLYSGPEDSLFAALHLDIEPIQNPANKNALVFVAFRNEILQPYSPSVLRHDTILHLHYLPIYSLIYEKEYFLLI